MIKQILFNFSSCSIPKPLDDSECLQKAGNKPATETSCNVGKKCPQWHVGAWKSVIMLLIGALLLGWVSETGN